MRTTELSSVALLMARDRRLGLALSPMTAWRDLYGLRTARLELPGVAHVYGATPQAEVLALSATYVGRAATPLPTRWTYGPSPQHAVDRALATDPGAAPFLRFERMAPKEPETVQPPRLIAIEVYRATTTGDAALDPAIISALLWLPLAALRRIVSGARLGELLAMEDVLAERAPGATLPQDALVYLPSEYGERHLLRIAAKYGESALYATPDGGA
ncbi:MAG TPA: hypothetical protein VE338_12305 [Ktedonobacterales bacterium]|jgi:hypothetical protein|nr:hypothetical protein [Ktedonobacterales bacterium]